MSIRKQVLFSGFVFLHDTDLLAFSGAESKDIHRNLLCSEYLTVVPAVMY